MRNVRILALFETTASTPDSAQASFAPRLLVTIARALRTVLRASPTREDVRILKQNQKTEAADSKI